MNAAAQRIREVLQSVMPDMPDISDMPGSWGVFGGGDYPPWSRLSIRDPPKRL